MVEPSTQDLTSDVMSFVVQYGNIIWMGLTDLKTEGNFLWNSTGLELNFTSWFWSQPPNTISYSCVLFSGSIGEWQNSNCASLQPTVCQSTGVCRFLNNDDTTTVYFKFIISYLIQPLDW